MHRTPVFPAFAAALAALATGCEWTGTSSSDSWSGSYDAMNFSGTYRSAATLESGSSEGATLSVRETVGHYSAGTYRYSGTLSHTPVNLASVQIQLGGITFTADGSGNLTSNYGSGKVTESGAWSVDVTQGSSSSSESGGNVVPVQKESIGSVSTKGSFTGNLSHAPVNPGSVTVTFDNGMSFTDAGNGTLTSSTSGAGGNVNYNSGSVTLDWSGASSSFKDYLGKVRADYSYDGNVTSTTTSTTPLSGSGSIIAVYSYGASSGASVVTSSSEITAITVSQSGQNLSMSTNTGIVMSGRFTAVRETNAASTSGTATYNAQFQVTSAAGHKFVGALNYDIATGHRTINGTLTAGNATYDVQGVGPAF